LDLSFFVNLFQDGAIFNKEKPLFTNDEGLLNLGNI